MISKTTYKCDFCNKEFDNEEGICLCGGSLVPVVWLSVDSLKKAIDKWSEYSDDRCMVKSSLLKELGLFGEATKENGRKG